MFFVYGFFLGVYKEDDNMGVINGMLLVNILFLVFVLKYLFLCGII